MTDRGEQRETREDQSDSTLFSRYDVATRAVGHLRGYATIQLQHQWVA